jgi:diketogulonate reductase-like aldo/keto reductase
VQVQYSLLYRRPETNGVLEACKEHGVTLVAYSPLCQGLLTGEDAGQGMRAIMIISMCCLAVVFVDATNPAMPAWLVHESG